MKVYAYGMYGMFGALADPINFRRFCRRVAQFCDIVGSPYRDYQTQRIVNDIMAHPGITFVFGASLGANNCPSVVQALNGHRKVDGIFGFQASAFPGAARIPITPNCSFAHEVINPRLLLGSYRWVAVDPRKTKVVIDANNDMHPGDYDIRVQDAFIADMKRIMREANA